LAKLYAWIAGFRYPNFIGGDAFTFHVNVARKIDAETLGSLGLKGHDHHIDSVSLYNAQDYYLQHAYPMPKRYQISSFLDFGAGHGRQANLWFGAGRAPETFIAVDAVPATYLTQRLYYRALGLSMHDYIDDGPAS
jgi:hypothetical protein